jgi:signal transduction histidine kinase
MASIIHKNGETLLSIIHEIIEIYKINSGKITVEKNTVDISSILKEIVHSLEPLYKKKKQKIRLETENLSLESDYKRLSQIFTNLISNAIKYTHPEGEIWIRCYEKDGQAVAEVEDRGIGMDAEDLENLFIPFKRGKKAYETEEGSGLGLFITYQLIKVLGGDIKVESHPENGSKFCVSFPLNSLNI